MRKFLALMGLICLLSGCEQNSSLNPKPSAQVTASGANASAQELYPKDWIYTPLIILPFDVPLPPNLQTDISLKNFAIAFKDKDEGPRWMIIKKLSEEKFESLRQAAREVCPTLFKYWTTTKLGNIQIMPLLSNDDFNLMELHCNFNLGSTSQVVKSLMLIEYQNYYFSLEIRDTAENSKVISAFKDYVLLDRSNTHGS